MNIQEIATSGKSIECWYVRNHSTWKVSRYMREGGVTKRIDNDDWVILHSFQHQQSCFYTVDTEKALKQGYVVTFN